MNREFSKKAASLIDERVTKKRLTRKKQKELLEAEDESFFHFTPSKLINNSRCEKIHGSEVINDYLQQKYYDRINNKSDYVHLRVCTSSIS